MSFMVAKQDIEKAKAVASQLKAEHYCDTIMVRDNIALVSVIGVGMRSQFGVAERMFGALAKAKVNIESITTSEIRISCAVGPRMSREPWRRCAWPSIWTARPASGLSCQIEATPVGSQANNQTSNEQTQPSRPDRIHSDRDGSCCLVRPRFRIPSMVRSADVARPDPCGGLGSLSRSEFPRRSGLGRRYASARHPRLGRGCRQGPACRDRCAGDGRRRTPEDVLRRGGYSVCQGSRPRKACDGLSRPTGRESRSLSAAAGVCAVAGWAFPQRGASLPGLRLCRLAVQTWLLSEVRAVGIRRQSPQGGLWAGVTPEQSPAGRQKRTTSESESAGND